jgi:lactate permease
LLGGLLGLAVVSTAARKGLFCPTEVWDFEPRESQPEAWWGDLEIESDTGPLRWGVWRSWCCYVLVALLLVLTRLEHLPFLEDVSLKSMLRSPAVTISFSKLFGAETISAASQPLYLPFASFVVVSAIGWLLFRVSPLGIAEVFQATGKTIFKAGAALIFAVPMVQIFINSAENAAGLSAMPIALAAAVADLAGEAWALVAPCIGALGAFVAGSNTISNMTFALFQWGVADQLGFETSWVVAQQAVGGAAGNMICIHNVVAASAVVGLAGREGNLIRITALPMFYYLAAAGLLGAIVLLL